jgi:YVTN family beta-propeller protein
MQYPSSLRPAHLSAHRRTLILASVALGTTVLAAAPLSLAAQGTTAVNAPKAYVGLFKDNAVAVLDTSTNKVTKTIAIPSGPHGLVVTPDGRWVYASSDGASTVSVIDTRTDQVSTSIEVGPTPHGLAITPDGSRVLVAGFGTDQVEAIDTSTNQVVWQVAVPQPHNIAITPDGTTAYAGSQQKGAEALAIIDLGTATQTGRLPLDHAPRALNVSSDGADIAYTLAGVDALQIADLTAQQLEAQIPTGASPHHPLFTPDGKLGLVVSQGPGTLDLFDPATYMAGGSIKVGTMPHWIGLTSDSRWAYVTNESSNDVSVVDLAEQKVTATVPVGSAPRKIVVQPGPTASGPVSRTTSAAAPATDAATISISHFAFTPATITVKPGQAITFTNSDPVAHTATSLTAAWDSGDLSPGGTFTTTLQQPGTYAYNCSIHPFMQGTIIVQD